MRPIAGERLVAEVRDRAGIRLELLGRLPGGHVGAALVRLPDGSTAVMSSWSRERYERIPVITRVVDRLREAGYPAPAYRHVVDCGDVVAVVQDYVDGGWVGAVTVGLLRNLLDLNGRQRQVFDRPAGSLDDLYLSQDGPGFCLHAPLASHSAESRVTLGFACDFMPTEPPVAGLLRDHIRAIVPPEHLVAFTAHMALRMVDWAIRHFPPPRLARWIGIAQDWRSFAVDSAHRR